MALAAEPADDPFGRARRLVAPGLRAAADRMNSSTRRVIGYHLGWWDEHGNPTDDSGGKALRPTLAMLAAEAVGGSAERAANAAVAVELAHNFSLLHDDIMDGDRRRRHRPTAWTVFGVPAAIIAGDALSTLAAEALVADGPPLATDGVPRLNAALLRLDDGQAADVAFEGRAEVPLEECLTMAGDKTSALFAAACELGAMSAGASPQRVRQLRQFGEHLGLVFQLADDLLGIWGDPAETGKPVLSDLRARKKSIPVVAALDAGNVAAARLAELYCGAEPLDDAALRRCADLIEEAGARTWALQETQRRTDMALACLQAANPEPAAAAQLAALVRQLGTGPAGLSAAESLELPVFHSLRPARLNPHLDAVRAHALAWAADMAMVAATPGRAPWTESRFTAEDYALLTCYLFPDAGPGTIETLTDWNTWLFHVDDHFAATCAPTGRWACDDAPVARLGEFMPADAARDTPTPVGSVERGLADLWARTAPSMSPDWRRRMRATVEQALRGNLHELRRTDDSRSVDPIEYLDQKRMTAAAPPMACLAEFARAAELPGAVVHALPMRTLVDSANDASLLVNDIHSYHRELAGDAAPANMVFVLREFLGCDLRQAVDMTADLVRSRLDQFEHAADVEVPEMIAGCGLDPDAAASVLGYVEALRQWAPGWQEWFARTERYPQQASPAPAEPAPRRLAGPTGLGTATAHRPLVTSRMTRDVR